MARPICFGEKSARATPASKQADSLFYLLHRFVDVLGRVVQRFE